VLTGFHIPTDKKTKQDNTKGIFYLKCHVIHFSMGKWKVQANILDIVTMCFRCSSGLIQEQNINSVTELVNSLTVS